MKPDIYISILNYNSLSETIHCLDSIKHLERKSFFLHTIVIDNSSHEKFEIDENMYKDIGIVVIKNDKNLGFSGGHNIGIKYSLSHGATHVLILNNDTKLDKNCLQELLKGFEIDKNIGIVVPKIYFFKGSEFHKDRYEKKDLGKVIWFAGQKMDWKNVIGKHIGVDEVDSGQYNASKSLDFGTGACMLVKREVFERVGKFNELYFLYYEDADLFMRVKKSGFSIYYIPGAIVWHYNAASSGGSGSSLQDYYITRNRLLFGLKYAPLRTKIALFREGVRILLNGRKLQKKGVLDFILGNFGKGSFSKN